VALAKEEALDYLRKGSLSPAINKQGLRGWALASYEGVALGWMKVLPNRINNYYPKSWRLATMQLWLKELVRKLGQIAAFALPQGNVRIQWMVLYVFNEVRKAIALRVEVRGVYLVDVARKDNLGVLARPGNDGLYFVGCEVLCFIHDEENLGEGAAADKR